MKLRALRNISLFSHKFLISIFLFAISTEDVHAAQSCGQSLAINFSSMAKNSKEDSGKRIQLICKNNSLVLSSRKKTLQSIDLPENGSFHLADIDEDGNLDLIIVEGGGNPNSTMWVWFFNSKERKFEAPQEIGAFEFFKDFRGYRVTSGKGSANSWSYIFYNVNQKKLVPKLELNVSLEDQNTKCTLQDQKTKEILALTDYFKKYYCSHYEERKESPVAKDYLQ